MEPNYELISHRFNSIQLQWPIDLLQIENYSLLTFWIQLGTLLQCLLQPNAERIGQLVHNTRASRPWRLKLEILRGWLTCKTRVLAFFKKGGWKKLVSLATVLPLSLSNDSASFEIPRANWLVSRLNGFWIIGQTLVVKFIDGRFLDEDKSRLQMRPFETEFGVKAINSCWFIRKVQSLILQQLRSAIMPVWQQPIKSKAFKKI